MKILILFVVLPFLSICQMRLIFDQNLDIYKPYTAESKEYLQLNNSVFSITSRLNMNFAIYRID